MPYLFYCSAIECASGDSDYAAYLLGAYVLYLVVCAIRGNRNQPCRAR